MKKIMLLIAAISALLSSCEKDKVDPRDLPVLTTIIPYDITAEAATSGGEITSDGGTEITARGVCWDSIPEPTVADHITADGTGIGSFTSDITGLASGTTYYVRAYATNQAGTNYGNEEMFVSASAGTFVDERDGNAYRTVNIGTQTWMAENLRYLPEVHTNSEFDHRTSPGYGVYGYNGKDVAAAKDHPNYSAYGVIYNYPSASNSCPVGWHLPSADEWDELEDFIKSDGVVAPGWEGNALKSTHGWNCGVSGTDNYGFTALAGGVRGNGGAFFDIGLYSDWWTSTEGINDCCSAYRELACSYLFLVSSEGGPKHGGKYVRCIKN
jgi:uncharacterized protein (TIGR02145 family)